MKITHFSKQNIISQVIFNTMLEQLGISRCNVRGCCNPPAAFVENDVAGSIEFAAGICEEHIEAAKKSGRWNYTFVFDPPAAIGICNN